MPREPSQPLKILDDEYKKFPMLRELEHIHKTMNDRLNDLLPMTTVTTSRALLRGESGTIFMVDTSAARSIFLPAPELGLHFWIKDATGAAATNNITLVRFASEAIDGTGANLVISTNRAIRHLVSDGLSWFLL